MPAIEGLFLCLWCVCSAESRSIGKFCGVVAVVCACFLASLLTFPLFSLIQSLNHSFLVCTRAIEGAVWCFFSAESRSIGKFCGVVAVVSACFLSSLLTFPLFSIFQSLNHSFDHVCER